jgi:DNA helicase HerA-like ATPase
MRRASEKSSLTSDTPVPYRIADLLALIDERIGRLEGRDEKPALRNLKMRIMAAINDPRYHFMFSNSTITDTIMETVAHIFRVPGEGKPISVFQLAGIPSEVVNSVASVLCRMAFELALWSQGAIHTLVVCEEAHRYVPARLLPHAAGNRPHCQGGPQIRRLPRHHHPAPRRARPDNTVAMLDSVCHAPLQ